MLVEDALSIADYLTAKHGLQEHWSISFEAGKSDYLAYTDHHSKTICFTTHYISWAKKVRFYNTVVHEIAHALLPVQVELHGLEWESLARKLGVQERHLKSMRNIFPLRQEVVV